MSATNSQQTSLKVLAAAVLARNRGRNSSATTEKNLATNAENITPSEGETVASQEAPQARGICHPPEDHASMVEADEYEDVQEPEASTAPHKGDRPLSGIEATGSRKCCACGRTDWWRSQHDVTVCRKCHPPAPGAETPHIEPSIVQHEKTSLTANMEVLRW